MAKKGAGIMKPKKISKALASVIGKGPISRGNVMKKIWIYIKKKKGMQEGRTIHLNDELKELFNTRKKSITMFDLAKLLSPHIENGDGVIVADKGAGPKKKNNPSYDDDEDEDEEDEDEDEDDYDDEDEDEDEDEDDYDDEDEDEDDE